MVRRGSDLEGTPHTAGFGRCHAGAGGFLRSKGHDMEQGVAIAWED